MKTIITLKENTLSNDRQEFSGDITISYSDDGIWIYILDNEHNISSFKIKWIQHVDIIN